MMDSLTILSSLKREVRFTVFEVVSPNQRLQPLRKPHLNSSMINNVCLSMLSFTKVFLKWRQATFMVSKCKMHYIDCINVVSYEIHDVCPKIKFLTQFSDAKTSNTNSIKCPIFGDYKFNNITLDADKFGSVFSFPTEKWWENYWKFKVVMYAEGRTELAYANSNFYFIEFRSRNNKQKIL
ncbi:Uncharacterized protein FWK35_00026488 [Aphis craccivora]|uniref:Uncharacterized protein n=1 Tax=Aphis craccivora TaxID=307492 RepID=A0A6G0YRV5_APHCR|nr:Uncharacterized protein FWK35_00026488 [Aphis craccivora]